MVELDSPLHLDMLRDSQRNGQIERDGIYGMHWRDPQTDPVMRRVRDHFLLPYVHPDHTAIEIGPGGGRWTRYMLGFAKVYAVDYHQPLLDELARNYKAPHLIALKNNGTDFPGIASESIDFVFTFAVFVHFDLPVIEAYLRSIRRVLKRDGQAVLHYSDKRKPKAQAQSGISDNDPERMCAAVRAAGFEVVEEDRDLTLIAAILRAHVAAS